MGSQLGLEDWPGMVRPYSLPLPQVRLRLGRQLAASQASGGQASEPHGVSTMAGVCREESQLRNHSRSPPWEGTPGPGLPLGAGRAMGDPGMLQASCGKYRGWNLFRSPASIQVPVVCQCRVSGAQKLGGRTVVESGKKVEFAHFMKTLKIKLRKQVFF